MFKLNILWSGKCVQFMFIVVFFNFFCFSYQQLVNSGIRTYYWCSFGVKNYSKWLNACSGAGTNFLPCPPSPLFPRPF